MEPECFMEPAEKSAFGHVFSLWLKRESGQQDKDEIAKGSRWSLAVCVKSPLEVE